MTSGSGRGGTRVTVTGLLWAIVAVAIAALPAHSQSAGADSEISRALSAAPPAVAAGAAVARLDSKGQRVELRAGSNGWTCLANEGDPLHPDGIEHHPACYDQYGMEWLEAWESHRQANPDHVGYAYMLQGGSSWSNTDPNAKGLAPGQKDYIRIPPHIMVLSSKAANSSGFPSGQSNPDTHVPFVMFGGTPAALLIIPVNLR
jgi:hypothetical protein